MLNFKFSRKILKYTGFYRLEANDFNNFNLKL